MALTKYKLGELIEESKDKNTDGKISKVQGITSAGIFDETKANMTGIDIKKYKIVPIGYFGYTRRIYLGSIAYNDDEPIVVSPSYTVFKISNTQKLLPEYLKMWLTRSEFLRQTTFYMDHSILNDFDFNDLCDMEIELPPIEVQQEYVDIYNALLENLEAYERGTEDLKLVCDGYIEELRRNMDSEPIGTYIVEVNDKNADNKFTVDDVRGVSIQKCFIPTKADMTNVPLHRYLLIEPDSFVYVPTTSRNGEKITLAHNTSEDTYIVSSSYTAFKISKTDALLSDYLFMYFNRPEFDRYSRYHSWGTARETFNWEDMQNIKIPIPDLETQQAIADIYNVYIERQDIAQRVKEEMQDICPILIAGSIREDQ